MSPCGVPDHGLGCDIGPLTINGGQVGCRSLKRAEALHDGGCLSARVGRPTVARLDPRQLELNDLRRDPLQRSQHLLRHLVCLALSLSQVGQQVEVLRAERKHAVELLRGRGRAFEPSVLLFDGAPVASSSAGGEESRDLFRYSTRAASTTTSRSNCGTRSMRFDTSNARPTGPASTVLSVARRAQARRSMMPPCPGVRECQRSRQLDGQLARHAQSRVARAGVEERDRESDEIGGWNGQKQQGVTRQAGYGRSHQPRDQKKTTASEGRLGGRDEPEPRRAFVGRRVPHQISLKPTRSSHLCTSLPTLVLLRQCVDGNMRLQWAGAEIWDMSRRY